MARKASEPGVDRRQLILDAALEEFAELGFEAATNKGITERAGVNQGLIYFYFESKADVFFATFETHARKVVAQLDAVFEKVQGGSEQGLRSLLRGIIQVLETPTAISLLRIMHQVIGSHSPQQNRETGRDTRSMRLIADHVAQKLQEYLEAQIAVGKLNKVSTDLAAYVISSTLITSIASRRRISKALENTSQEDVTEMIITLFCFGLLPRDETPDVS